MGADRRRHSTMSRYAEKKYARRVAGGYRGRDRPDTKTSSSRVASVLASLAAVAAVFAAIAAAIRYVSSCGATS